MLVRSLPMKSRNRLARDVFNAFATRTGLIAFDITGTDRCAQNSRFNQLTVVFSRLSNVGF